MKALIIEDETAAATNLKSLLREIDPSVEIVDVIDTVVDSIGWIRANPLPDIVFMDIHLADGQAFKIFESISPARSSLRRLTTVTRSTHSRSTASTISSSRSKNRNSNGLSKNSNGCRAAKKPNTSNRPSVISRRGRRVF